MRKFEPSNLRLKVGYWPGLGLGVRLNVRFRVRIRARVRIRDKA